MPGWFGRLHRVTVFDRRGVSILGTHRYVCLHVSYPPDRKTQVHTRNHSQATELGKRISGVYVLSLLARTRVGWKVDQTQDGELKLMKH